MDFESNFIGNIKLQKGVKKKKPLTTMDAKEMWNSS